MPPDAEVDVTIDEYVPEPEPDESAGLEEQDVM